MHGPAQCFSSRDDIRGDREDIALQRTPAGLLAVWPFGRAGAGKDLAMGEFQEHLAGVRPFSLHAAQFPPFIGQAHGPTRTGQGARSLEDGIQGGLQVRASGHQFLDAALQAARA